MLKLFIMNSLNKIPAGIIEHNGKQFQVYMSLNDDSGHELPLSDWERSQLNSEAIKDASLSALRNIIDKEVAQSPDLREKDIRVIKNDEIITSDNVSYSISESSSLENVLQMVSKIYALFEKVKTDFVQYLKEQVGQLKGCIDSQQDDYGNVINQLLVNYGKGGENYFWNLQEHSKKLGFDVIEGAAGWVRDYKLKDSQGNFKCSTYDKTQVKAINKIRSPWGDGLGRSFETMGTVGRNGFYKNSHEGTGLDQNGIDKTYSYFEGGNLLYVSDPYGHRYAIYGKYHFDITNNIYKYHYDKDYSKYIKNTLLPKEYDVESHRCICLPQIAYHLDVLLKKGPGNVFFMQDFSETIKFLEKIRTENKEDLTNDELELISIYIDHARTIEERGNQIMQQAKDALEACEFLPINSIKAQIIKDIEFLKQLSSHPIMIEQLDKIILLVSASKTLVEMERAVLPKLDTEGASDIVEKTFECIRERITKNHFKVVPTPGAFLAPKYDGRSVNFFNSISGFSPKTKRHYTIVPGSSMGTTLGSILMKYHKQFLEENCGSNLDVYFIGYNPNNKNDFSQADYLTNNFHAGPHCASFELAHSTGPSYSIL